MRDAGALDRALAQLSSLLAEQADALREGQADALPALADSLAQGLRLLRSMGTAAGDAGARRRLTALHARARANLQLLHARQLDAMRALEALGAGNTLLGDLQTRRVYAAAGGLTSAARPARSFASA